MVSLSFGPAILLILHLGFLALPCFAQTNRLFQWQFANNFVSTDLPTCQDFQVIVKSFNADNSTHGTPPYYMMAFEINGTPTTALLGSDQNNLHWTVNHAVGTKLMLSVVDANQSAGGIPPRLFSVVAGQSTQCLSLNSTQPDFTVKANVTDTVTTCDPWGISITGGVRPYVVTLAALNSPVVTNVTLGPNDDHFTYIDRADPNGVLLVAVSDLTGRFASGTPSVNTKGSTNVDCVGLVSSGGNSTQIQQAADAAAHAAEVHKRNKIIIAVCVTVGVLAVLGAVLGFLWYRWRLSRIRNGDYNQDTVPRKYEEVATGQLVAVSYPDDIPPPTRSPKGGSAFSTSSLPLSSSHYADAAAFDPYRSIRDSDSSQQNSSFGADLHSRPSFAAFPATSRRYNKAAEAAGAVNRPSSSNSYSDNDPSAATSAAAHHANLSHAGSALGEEPEIIIQHRDAGIVRELPPPYADRSAPR